MTVVESSPAGTSAATGPAPVAGRPAHPAAAERVWRAFVAILWRDVLVSGKEFGVLMLQVAVAPLFILFIFGKVLGEMGYVSGAYGELLLPGIVALSAFLAALQSVAFPLVMEFGWTKEIEDRLLAPLPTGLVAIEKLVVATLRGIVSAAIMYPVGALVLGSAPWRPDGVPLLLLMLLAGGWVGGAVGMVVGTLVPPTRINVMFAVILAPLMFTGSIQYPWPLLDRLPWFQVVSALNPLTYCAEGVRAAVVPQVAHLAPWVCVVALLGSAGVFTALGLFGFRRRAIS